VTSTLRKQIITDVAAPAAVFRLHPRRNEEMRLSGVAALVLVTTGASASETVCMIQGGDRSIVYRARTIAARILKDAGVAVEFKDGARSCALSGSTIVIRMSDQTPDAEHPGALAYAMPFERTRIVVFYDRVAASVGSAGVACLLGHVLAHEIAHMFQAVEYHASSGIMKARWNHRDLVDMQRRPLRFTEEDVLLIRQGLKGKVAPSASHEVTWVP
jgi:hypothetical protein